MTEDVLKSTTCEGMREEGCRGSGRDTLLNAQHMGQLHSIDYLNKATGVSNKDTVACAYAPYLKQFRRG